MHTVSVFFAYTVNAKARHTSTMTYVILASACGDRETMQASSAYSMPHTARRTKSIAGSGPIDVGGSFRRTSWARMAGSSLNLWRTTVNTAAKKMLNNSGESTHMYVCMYICIFFKFHITAQSDPVIQVILCHSHSSSQGGINNTYFENL